MKQFSVHAARLAVAPLVLSSLVLTGCSGRPVHEANSNQAAARPPGVTAVPEITTRVTKSVPIQEYLLTEEQWAKLVEAELTLRQRCMKSFGIEYEPPSTAGIVPRQSISQYRYGILDPATTEVNGYRSPSAMALAGTAAAARERRDEKLAEYSPAQLMVLNGVVDPGTNPGSSAVTGGGKYRGKEVPPGGCVGEARRRLGDYGDSPVANDVNLDSFDKSLRDRRVQDVFARWSACMKERGYSYRTPIDASNDERWEGEKPSPEEKEAATADATCKIENNVAGVWYAVDVAYQHREIMEKGRQLRKVKEEIESDVETAETVIGD
ncbi:hypothetical protein [Actinacidiphila glaucinigra]|uniref:hypothetical protein n=1 Tax=Actinacidiphila glaucinigra TaxID=235986 RepID=UPI0037199690